MITIYFMIQRLGKKSKLNLQLLQRLLWRNLQFNSLEKIIPVSLFTSFPISLNLIRYDSSDTPSIADPFLPHCSLRLRKQKKGEKKMKRKDSCEAL